MPLAIDVRFLLIGLGLAAGCVDRSECRFKNRVCGVVFASPQDCGVHEELRLRAEEDHRHDGAVWTTDPDGRCVALRRYPPWYPEGYSSPAPRCNEDLLVDPGVCGASW